MECMTFPVSCPPRTLSAGGSGVSQSPGSVQNREMLMTDVATAADNDKITGEILKIADVVVLGAIMSILDVTVVNVALPTFQTTFGSVGHPLPYSTVAWAVTGYTLALATVIPVTGWAAD